MKKIIVFLLLLCGVAIAANIKISELTELATLATDDEMVIVDTSSVATKKVTIATLDGRYTGAVSSVFGRTGAVTATTNDYTWAQIDKTTSDIADITTKSHTSLTDKGTNTHAQIDTHIAATSSVHGITTFVDGAGISNGQTIFGGTGSSDNLVLRSTSDATSGIVNIGDSNNGAFFNESTNRMSIGLEEFEKTVSGLSLGARLLIHNDGASDSLGLSEDRHTDVAGFGASFAGFRSRGTESAPAIVQNGDNIIRIDGYGFDGIDFEPAAQIDIVVDGTPGADDMPGAIIFNTTPDGTAAVVEGMRITNNGSIGIDEASPIYKVDTGNNADDIIRVGRSMMGAWGANNAKAFWSHGALDPSVATDAALVQASDGSTNLNAKGTKDIAFTSDGSIRMLFDGATNNFGVGETNPTARLHVQGAGATSATDALIVENSASTIIIHAEDGGNVGVGTSSPGETLHVNGHMKGDLSHGCIGEYNASGGGTAITVTVAGTFYPYITAAATGVSDGLSFVDDAGGDRLDVDSGKGGDYKVVYGVSFTATSNALVECCLFKTGTKETQACFRRKVGSGGDVGSGSGRGILALADTDYLDLRCTSNGAADTVTPEIVNICASRVGL